MINPPRLLSCKVNLLVGDVEAKVAMWGLCLQGSDERVNKDLNPSFTIAGKQEVAPDEIYGGATGHGRAL